MDSTSSTSQPTLITGASFIDEAFATSVVPRRTGSTHKWEIGGVLVIAGSPSFVGAAYLTSRAAGRTGAGIVRLASGRAVISMLASAMPEVSFVALPETDAPGSAKRALERLQPSLEKVSSIVLGPGLGDDESTDHLLSALFGFGNKASQIATNIGFGPARGTQSRSDDVAPLFTQAEMRVVVDADALKWLAQQDEWWTRVPQDSLVLTPHPGEMSGLTGRSADEVVADAQAVAMEYAAKWGQTVLLKTGNSVVSDGTTCKVAADAPASLAKAGSGDVLAGSVGALLAQGLAPLDAASLAVYLGQKAARTLESTYGPLGVIATDFPEAIAVELGRSS